MTLSNSLAAYTDVAGDLNAMLPDGGRRVCLNIRAAVHWRHRANKYRALLRSQDGSTPYDHFVFRITAQEPNVVVVTTAQMGGHIETLDGQRLEPVKEGPTDELTEQARALAKELGLD